MLQQTAQQHGWRGEDAAAIAAGEGGPCEPALGVGRRVCDAVVSVREAGWGVRLGLGRIVALYSCSFTLYGNR
jgi:hypothetical protein